MLVFSNIFSLRNDLALYKVNTRPERYACGRGRGRKKRGRDGVTFLHSQIYCRLPAPECYACGRGRRRKREREGAMIYCRLAAHTRVRLTRIALHYDWLVYWGVPHHMYMYACMQKEPHSSVCW